MEPKPAGKCALRLTKTAVTSAERLLNAGKLWKFTDRLEESPEDDGDGSAGAVPAGGVEAYVLDDAPVPYRVGWNGETAVCECSSAKKNCVHITALFLKVRECHPDHPNLPIFPQPGPVSAAGPKASGSVVPKQKDAVPEVEIPRDEIPLSPKEDLLFFSEPNPVEKKAVFLLDRSDAVKEAMAKTSFVTVSRPEPPRQWDIKDMQGGFWTLSEAVITIREDGSTGRPKPPAARDPRPEWPGPAQAEIQSPSAQTQEQEPEALVAALLMSGEPPVTLSGEPWRMKKNGGLHLRFDPLLTAAEDEPFYEPTVEIRFESTGEQPLSGGLIPLSGSLLVLDEERGTSGCLENLTESMWFLRLILSRKVMNAADIRARFHGSRTLPQGIRADLPQLPEALKTLKPVPVLDIVERGNVTDFKPGWHYGGVFVTAARRSDIIMGPGKKARPLGLRDRREEEGQFLRLEEILADNLSWRRGRYASLSGDASAPLRLEMPMSEVLASYGKRLMETGAEIRLEDRPVKLAGSLSLHTRREGSVMEMNAVIQVPGEGTYGLDLDEWLEKGGLARTKDAYFNLTDKALDQLHYLRSHGMEDSGFLSTSPDNLSLIDAVYSRIEAEEETAADIEHRRELFRNLSEFSPEGTPPPPPEFRASLRPYQSHGYAWLLSMRENHLGGCLADDMGLGKTVQTLAYLSRLKADNQLGPSLLVGPVVTLGNWEAEIARFAPDLNHTRYSGAAGKRQIPDKDEGVDILIVSYQMLRNDADQFLAVEWNHVVLDEAHYVKNASSQTFKTVRSLQCSYRVSLTGTPLENHLSELWSQMNFLNPGLLGTRGQFAQQFVKPVEKDGNEDALGRLSGIVSPFILRRKKKDVLDDLPPKDETVLRCEMTQAQAKAYNAMRDLYYHQVTGLLNDEGLKGARMEIFTILSRLRLLAIHPSLAGEQFAGIPSGKMNALDNLLEEIMEEDHKTLVFSQFLGALDKVQAECENRSWRFSRLTGATRNREEQIENFRNDTENRIFLLSLKAGGVGINLTAADYVILLDPWWNPAVEAQAVDRTHRMGQKRPVMAYRLITSGTIEEKVLELQQKKRDLISGVLGNDGAPEFSEEDILGLLERTDKSSG